MKSRCWGYDKNQVRVYFTALQAGHQRRLDQWEEEAGNLRTEIKRQERLLEQLQTQVDAGCERMEHLEAVWPATDRIRIKMLRQARIRSRTILSKAAEIKAGLEQERDRLSEQANRQHGAFGEIVAAVLSTIPGSHQI